MTDLAILIQPYYDMTLNLIKTADMRLFKSRFPPYCRNPRFRSKIGDAVYLKKSGGEIGGLANIKEMAFFDQLTPSKIEEIITKNNDVLCIQNGFLKEKKESLYGVIIWWENVRRIQPIRIKKIDQQAWIHLTSEKNWGLDLNV